MKKWHLLVAVICAFAVKNKQLFNHRKMSFKMGRGIAFGGDYSFNFYRLTNRPITKGLYDAIVTESKF